MAAELTFNGVTWKTDKVQSVSALFDMLGFLPMFLSDADDDNAVKQFDKHHISGWNSVEGFSYNKDTHALLYPGDPPMKPIASATLRNETILLYPHAFVAVVGPNDAFDIARLD